METVSPWSQLTVGIHISRCEESLYFLKYRIAPIFLSVVGAYVVRTSSLNDKHSCQLYKNGFADKTTPTSITPLIMANMSCG